jgi:general secretion pathway protein C
MGLNLPGRYLTVINLALIAAMAYFAALAVNDVITGRSAGEVKVAPRPKVMPPPSEKTYPRSAYDAIIQRNVFVPPEEEQPAPAASEDLHLRLLGTSLQTTKMPWAIIEDERNGRQTAYQLNDDVGDAGKLVEVDPTRIYIERQGKRVSLDMPINQLPGPPPVVTPQEEPPPRPLIGFGPSSSAGIQPLGGNRFVLDREAVNGNLQNMMSLLTQMRAVPDMEDGRARGFRLSEIQPGSVFQQMGLTNGDVVTNIDGQPLNDPTMTMQLLASLRYRQAINLSVMRNGRPLQFVYEIR